MCSTSETIGNGCRLFRNNNLWNFFSRLFYVVFLENELKTNASQMNTCLFCWPFLISRPHFRNTVKRQAHYNKHQAYIDLCIRTDETTIPKTEDKTGGFTKSVTGERCLRFVCEECAVVRWKEESV